jgi:hypothetical protein
MPFCGYLLFLLVIFRRYRKNVVLWLWFGCKDFTCVLMRAIYVSLNF